MTKNFRDKILSSNGVLGDGRAFVLMVFVPVISILPWLLVTGGDPPRGQSGGLFASVDIATVKPNGPALVREAAHRVQLMSVTSLLAFVSLLIGAFAVLRAWRTATKKMDHIVVGLVWLALIVVVGKLALGSTGDKRAYELLGQGLFANTLGMIDGGAPLRQLGRQLDWANGAVVFAATSLALAAASVAIAAHRFDKTDKPTELDRLTHQLDLILLLGAVVLVVGVIHVKEWHSGPLPFIYDKANVDAYSALATAHLGLQSVCFVGVLVGIYLPAAMVLQFRRNRLDPLPTEAGKANSVNPIVSSLFRVGAMLSPVLVGPLTSIAELKLPT